jgi:phosphatidylglycerophosphatase A
MISLICKYLATWGTVGYVRAPGTIATLTALPLVILTSKLLSVNFYALFCIAISIFGLAVIYFARDFHHAHKDPAEIVIDEVVGCFITFIGIPICWPSIIIGFIVFRILDISKACGIGYFEKLPRPWGIMLDDIAAGIITNIVLRILFL